MTHHDVQPVAACPGTIKPRYRRTRDGWRRRLGWRCDTCGLHFFKDAWGRLAPGINLALKGPNNPARGRPQGGSPRPSGEHHDSP